jgi:hypothetical protein
VLHLRICWTCVFLYDTRSLHWKIKVNFILFMKNSVFLDIMLCSQLKVNRCFGGIYYLHLQGRRKIQARKKRETDSEFFFILVCCLAYSSTPKKEMTRFSETSLRLRWTKRHYIPEDTALSNHRCENLKFYLYFSLYLPSICFVQSSKWTILYLSILSHFCNSIHIKFYIKLLFFRLSCNTLSIWFHRLHYMFRPL